MSTELDKWISIIYYCIKREHISLSALIKYFSLSRQQYIAWISAILILWTTVQTQQFSLRSWLFHQLPSLVRAMSQSSQLSSRWVRKWLWAILGCTYCIEFNAIHLHTIRRSSGVGTFSKVDINMNFPELCLKVHLPPGGKCNLFCQCKHWHRGNHWRLIASNKYCWC